MTTQIFKNWLEFHSREDKKVNGVSEDFAKEHPDFAKDNETNEGCWNCSDCSGCSRCSRCSDCSGCSDCSRCSRCSDCSGCSDCSDCSRCSDCSGCSDCSDCSDCSRCSGCSRCSRCSGCSRLRAEKGTENVSESGIGTVPVIESIHQKVFEAVSKPGALDMGSWHTCETTHCRAGWVVHLAGEAGLRLEARTNTPFAAQQIYKASCPQVPVAPPRFYEHSSIALADIQRCAEEEKALQASK